MGLLLFRVRRFYGSTNFTSEQYFELFLYANFAIVFQLLGYTADENRSIKISRKVGYQVSLVQSTCDISSDYEYIMIVTAGSEMPDYGTFHPESQTMSCHRGRLGRTIIGSHENKRDESAKIPHLDDLIVSPLACWFTQREPCPKSQDIAAV